MIDDENERKHYDRLRGETVMRAEHFESLQEFLNNINEIRKMEKK